MKKYLDLIGSALLACWVVPAHSFVSNYPQFGLRDTLLIVAMFFGIFTCIATPMGFVLKDIGKISFLMYGGGTVFLVKSPVSRVSQQAHPNVGSCQPWFPLVPPFDLLSACRCLFAFYAEIRQKRHFYHKQIFNHFYSINFRNTFD